MKTLLLNGCSFGQYWPATDEFIKKLGCTDVINISKAGTSFQRTCRSTIEWISQKGKPHMVLIPITFAHRWELALNKKEDVIDGSWIPLQNSNFLSDSYTLQESSYEDLKRLVDDYYKIIPTVKTYWDKMFTEIIMLGGWLESQKIDYLMWDMCNGFDKIHINGGAKPCKGFEKINLIGKNKKVIDLWSFCGNRFMRNTMPENIKKDVPEFAYHHAEEQYAHLEKYIIDYLGTPQ